VRVDPVPAPYAPAADVQRTSGGAVQLGPNVYLLSAHTGRIVQKVRTPPSWRLLDPRGRTQWKRRDT
jgi:hypothetical protein